MAKRKAHAHTPEMTDGQREFFRTGRSNPVPPTFRTGAPLPELTPAERLQERLEERRLSQNWLRRSR